MRYGICSITQKDIKMKTENLISYMKKRASFENIGWEFKDGDMELFFVQKGTRIFFGVVLDDLGNILEDKEQPEFFRSYCETN